jgi:uncharacterized protein (DUF302 family)
MKLAMKSVLAALVVSLLWPLLPAQAGSPGSAAPQVIMTDISHSVIKMGLAEGVKPEAAVEAMLSKAAELNMKLVGRQDVGAELRARGIDAPVLEILQFCNPEDAIKMVRFNTIYAAYMPCRIAVVADNTGKVWLEMLNLDMLITAYPLPDELRAIAITTNGQMLTIMTAGATGNF